MISCLNVYSSLLQIYSSFRSEIKHSEVGHECIYGSEKIWRQSFQSTSKDQKLLCKSEDVRNVPKLLQKNLPRTGGYILLYPLMIKYSNNQMTYHYLRERTAKPRLKWARPYQDSSPRRKSKSQADDEPFVSPDHTYHPVVFNSGVMLRDPAPFL